MTHVLAEIAEHFCDFWSGSWGGAGALPDGAITCSSPDHPERATDGCNVSGGWRRLHML